MILRAIEPFVRQVIKNFFRESCVYSFHDITTLDNRLFFILSGSGEIVINGTAYKLETNSVILFKAGTVYSWQTNNLVFFAVNFDYTQRNAKISSTFSPIRVENFHNQQLLDNTVFDDEDSFNHPIVLYNAFFLRQDIQRLSEIYYSKSKYSCEQMGAVLKSVILFIYDEICCSEACSGSNILSKKILNYIQENYNKNLSSAVISAEFNYSMVYLNRIFKQYAGYSIHQFLIQYRISMAAELLKNSSLTVADVACRVGFCDIPHFIKTFKSVTGHTPSSYRN